MQTGREQTVVHAMFQWIFFLRQDMKSNPLNPPYQGEDNSPLIRGARGVKHFLLASGP